VVEDDDNDNSTSLFSCVSDSIFEYASKSVTVVYNSSSSSVDEADSFNSSN
jgi:hypothetical protein